MEEKVKKRVYVSGAIATTTLTNAKALLLMRSVI